MIRLTSSHSTLLDCHALHVVSIIDPWHALTQIYIDLVSRLHGDPSIFTCGISHIARNQNHLDCGYNLGNLC